jgi:hypothetical protein
MRTTAWSSTSITPIRAAPGRCYSSLPRAAQRPRQAAIARAVAVRADRRGAQLSTRRGETDRRLGVSAELARQLKPGMYRVLKTSRELRDCNGCELDIAKALGAERVALCWVQKVSNLILNLNMEVRSVASGETVYAKSVDIRGNTDESWLRGVRRLVDNIEARQHHLR